MEEDFDINEVAFTIEVGREVIEKVRKGDIRCLILDINEQNQNMILENADGNGCYFYNNGVFPYAIKESLQFLLLTAGKEHCLVRIIGRNVEQGIRFNYKGAGQPIEEEPNGENCVWEVQFDILPILSDARTYLMRWNPSISSFTEKNYEECVANMKNGMFYLDWSIREWEQARRGDFFYMMRVGDDKAGIVFRGQFVSDPYVGDDWGGTAKRRLYVDMICTNPVEPGQTPLLSLNTLEKAIPSIDWSKGSSGILLDGDVVEALSDLWE